VRVAIVNSICSRHDAISDSVRGTQTAIAELTGCTPVIYCASCDYPDVNHRLVRNSLELIADREFMASDLVIYHFGVYYEFFNSIYLRFPGRRVVYYHNVTPKAFLPATSHALIDKSLRQRINLTAADAVWSASRFSRDELVALGFAEEKMRVMPLSLKFEPEDVASKPFDGRGANLLYVGRFVESKGVVDLIQAVAAIRDRSVGPFNLKLAGNLSFSDQGYLARVRALVTSLGLRDMVSFEGEVSDRRLAELYAEADIFVLPSYHEGFCVPLIEALNAGCVPVTYDSGNLADLVGDRGITTPAGDVEAYSNALGGVVASFANGRPETLLLNGGVATPWAAYHAGVADYLKGFSTPSRGAGGAESVSRVGDNGIR
jgi:glycosyltransferase involved in cell wall biosynthesis